MLNKFLITATLAAVLAPALIGCAGTIGTCTSDTDCGAGQTCDTATSTCSGGEGEGEGAAGEGEGEGGDCNGQDGALGAGAGLSMDGDAALSAGDPAADCTAIDGTTDFSLTFTINQANSDAWDGSFDNATAMAFSTSGTADSAVYNEAFCNGGFLTGVNLNDPGTDCDGSDDCLFDCPLCLSETPPDLAIQFTDSAAQSTDGTCVAVP